MARIIDLSNPYVLDETGDEVEKVLGLPYRTVQLTGPQKEQFTANTQMPASAGAFLAFESATSFTLAINNAAKNWDGTLEANTGSGWAEWDGTATLTSSAVDINHWHKILLRGTGNTKISGSAQKRFVLTGTGIYCYGDVRALLDYADQENTTMANSCFAYLFYNNRNLVKAPDLGALVLSDNCYRSMFEDCRGLIKPPALPAIRIKANSYVGMFSTCKAMTALPALPAVLIADGMYNYMFAGCSKIKFSETMTGEYVREYRIPQYGDGPALTLGWATGMFMNTGGTYTGDPVVNTTYYTPNEIIE